MDGADVLEKGGADETHEDRRKEDERDIEQDERDHKDPSDVGDLAEKAENEQRDHEGDDDQNVCAEQLEIGRAHV